MALFEFYLRRLIINQALTNMDAPRMQCPPH